MKSEFKIRKAEKNDIQAVTTIINSFAENSFAVYATDILPDSFAEERFKQARIFLVLEYNNKVVGFGFINRYKPFSNFDRTGVLTYFILGKYTRSGQGSKLLNELIKQGKKTGITNYLAHISSKNERSLRFHKKHGFEEVGRFRKVAVKFGEQVDVVWVQKDLEDQE